MSNEISVTRTALSNARGGRTRDRLLDAVETIAAESGLATLSHRVVARHARLHSGLIHYHFGTIERLVEEALARRAARLTRAQLAAISALQARGRWTVEDVVAALWQPFSALGGALDGGWRNYLCLIARLASQEHGDELVERHFDSVSRAAHGALRAVLPGIDDDALREGFRYTRILFEQEAIARCRKVCTAERRAQRDRMLIAFASAGIRSLAGAGDATIGRYASAAG